MKIYQNDKANDHKIGRPTSAYSSVNQNANHNFKKEFNDANADVIIVRSEYNGPAIGSNIGGLRKANELNAVPSITITKNQDSENNTRTDRDALNKFSLHNNDNNHKGVNIKKFYLY